MRGGEGGGRREGGLAATFSVRAGIAVPHVDADGGGGKAERCVEALQTLLQASVWAQEVLKGA